MKTTIKFLIALVLIITLVGCDTSNHEGEAKTPSASSAQKGKDYQEVISDFEEQGFTNIKTEILDDLITGWLTKDGEVESVSVDGNEDYSSDTWYPNDVEVIVTYHTFPIKDNDQNDKETDDKTETNETGQNDKEPDKETKTDEAQIIYEGAIGQPAINILNELEELGFTVSLKHAISQMDFTTSIHFESDPTDPETYIPWIITDLDSFDETSKSASFFINTQERIDELDAEDAQRDTLEAKLDPSAAWGTMDLYGKNEYPNGFKLNISKGMLAETAEDENTWFLKARCQVRSLSGTWIDYVCEANVTGTTASPQIDYFIIY